MDTRFHVRPTLYAFVLGLILGLSMLEFRTDVNLNAATTDSSACAPCVCPPAASDGSASAASSVARPETTVRPVESASQASVSALPASAAASSAKQETTDRPAESASQASAVSDTAPSSMTNIASKSAEAASSAQPPSVSSTPAVPGPVIGLIRMGTVKMAQYGIGAGSFYTLQNLLNDKDKVKNPDFSLSVNDSGLFLTTVMGISMPGGTTRVISGTQTAPAPGKWENINDPAICTRTLSQLTDYLPEAYTSYQFTNVEQALCFQTRDGIVGVMGVNLKEKTFVFKAWPMDGKSIPKPPAAAVEFFTPPTSPSASNTTISAQSPSVGTASSVASGVRTMASVWSLEGRGFVGFDLHTAQSNPKSQMTPGPENDLSMKAVVSQSRRETCTRGGGFRKKTTCSTTYVTTTTVHLSPMGVAEAKIVEINKKYGAVTAQDCADAIANGPGGMSSMPIQSTTVVCAQAKGANGGLLYAKIGGGTDLQNLAQAKMQVTVWMP